MSSAKDVKGPSKPRVPPFRIGRTEERQPLVVRLKWDEEKELTVKNLPRILAEAEEELEVQLISMGWDPKYAAEVANYVANRISPQISKNFKKVIKTG